MSSTSITVMIGALSKWAVIVHTAVNIILAGVIIECFIGKTQQVSFPPHPLPESQGRIDNKRGYFDSFLRGFGALFYCGVKPTLFAISSISTVALNVVLLLSTFNSKNYLAISGSVYIALPWYFSGERSYCKWTTFFAIVSTTNTYGQQVSQSTSG
jgi:hypothetical protein